jgi:hypothetical protein
LSCNNLTPYPSPARDIVEETIDIYAWRGESRRERAKPPLEFSPPVKSRASKRGVSPSSIFLPLPLIKEGGKGGGFSKGDKGGE